MIQSTAQFLVTDTVIAGIAVIVIAAFALEWLARFTERVSCHGLIHHANADKRDAIHDRIRALIDVGWVLQL